MGEASYRRHWGMPEGLIRDVTKQLEEQNEVKCGDAFLVRIPKIEGRIYTRTGGTVIPVGAVGRTAGQSSRYATGAYRAD